MEGLSEHYRDIQPYLYSENTFLSLTLPSGIQQLSLVGIGIVLPQRFYSP